MEAHAAFFKTISGSFFWGTFSDSVLHFINTCLQKVDLDQNFYVSGSNLPTYFFCRIVSDKHDFPAVEGVMKSILKEKQPFERLEITKENLLKMFAYNKFKAK